MIRLCILSKHSSVFWHIFVGYSSFTIVPPRFAHSITFFVSAIFTTSSSSISDFTVSDICGFLCSLSTSWSRVSLTVRIAAFLIIFVLLYDWCCYSLLMFVLPCFSVLLLSLCFLTCPYIVFLKKYQFLVGISLCCIANECMMCTEMHCKS